MPTLFDPLPIGGLTLRNRIGLSPMCQYSAVEGVANEWHATHLGRYAASGLGLLMVEATHVTRPGRITPGCLGLWNDEQGEALARIVRFIKRVDPEVKVGIQLAHSGRKGSADLPWRGGLPLNGEAWATVAPSALPHDEGWPTPQALDESEMKAILAAFVASAKRALAAGFDVVELHGAHGYLIHTFVSPASNRRSDAYGGTCEKRMRLPLEIAAAVRAVWPKSGAFGLRISGNDYLGEEGMSVADAVAFAAELKGLGADFLDVSGGGIWPSKMKIQVGPGYQVPSAERIKAEVGLPTFTVGMVLDARQANDIVTSGKADAVMIGRALLNDPLWPWHAAEALGTETFCPPQYLRAKKLGANVPRETRAR